MTSRATYYATFEDVELRRDKAFNEGEKALCVALLEDAAVIIDAYNRYANENAKKTVSCSMVTRAMANIGTDMPIGASQGSMSALGYSQSWTVSGGGVGELYLTKLDKKILGVGNKIASHSPLECMVVK